LVMVREITTRIGISLTREDRTLLRKVTRHLRAKNGKTSTSAAIRMAIRQMAQSLAEPQPPAGDGGSK
jgi:sulfur relay (sulfurtransferase) DsrC/TusE family protein